MRRSRRGFTLIELLIVLVVLGALAGLAIPAYISTVEKSRRQEALSALSSTRDSLLRAAALNANTYPAIIDFGSLDFDPNERHANVHRHYNYRIRSGQVDADPFYTPQIAAATNGFMVVAERNTQNFAANIAGTHDQIAITQDGVIHYLQSTGTVPAEQ